ncbi:MAG: serine acetyltransferase [Spirochaetales bacterium]|nr:serine acetyltransferase [Spirochaetales bacterium]
MMEGTKYIGFSGLKDQVVTLLRRLRSIMYPEIFEECPCTATTVIESSLEAESILNEIIPWVKPDADTQAITKAILEGLEGIRDILDTDVQAAYDGDPAARDKTEIMLAYPGFEAVSIFRIAHMLFEMDIPYIPRIMTELAHSHTGIDIHPGATIGRYFFIDHGTGVVIGETTIIGEHVKLYQGVTLGAKSFPVGDDGNPVKGIDRHPKIGNNVIIYAGATILGGDTHIGDNCIIGGNVWLTHSVSANSTIIGS